LPDRRDQNYWRTYFICTEDRYACDGKGAAVYYVIYPLAWVISDNVYHPAYYAPWYHCGPETKGKERTVRVRRDRLWPVRIANEPVTT
jgi:hypothetical protein